MLYIFLIVQSFNINVNPTAWQSNFEEAKQVASEEDKKILMVFAGSDWCAPCIKLKKKILITDEFQAFEKESIVVLYLDFPKRKKNRLSKELTKHNEALAEQYNRSGMFPNILLLDNAGKVVKTLKYEGQAPSDFIKEVQAGL
jgi:thioredoxin-related protein